MDVASTHDGAIEAAADRVIADGWTILSSALSIENLAGVRAAADRILVGARRREKKYGAPDDYGSRRVRELLGRGDVFWECASHQAVNGIVARLLGPTFIIGAAALNEVNPGARQQRLHRDDMFVPLPRPFAKPLIVNTIWALDDFTVTKGATRFVHQSHHADGDHIGDCDLMHAEMSAGGVFIFDGSLWHGSSENTTSCRRVGLVVTYCAGFLRPFENQLRGVSERRIAAMPPDRRRLVSTSMDVKISTRFPHLYD